MGAVDDLMVENSKLILALAKAKERAQKAEGELERLRSPWGVSSWPHIGDEAWRAGQELEPTDNARRQAFVGGAKWARDYLMLSVYGSHADQLRKRGWKEATIEEAQRRAEAAEARASSLTARLEALVGACKPFVEAAEPIEHDTGGRWNPDTWFKRTKALTVGDFRVLKAAHDAALALLQKVTHG